MKIFRSIFETSLGWCGLVGKERGLLELILPKFNRTRIYNYIISRYGTSDPGDKYFEDLIIRLIDYFQGNDVSLNFPLELSGFTSFQKKVWKATRKIPYGEIRTYGWIGKKIKSPLAFRAVGQALGKNPFPILVPCHRVIRNNGKIGGFSGGIDLKKSLLNLEGIKLDPAGRIEKLNLPD
jgi:methylated-DNA-[protein]-cysteine S-methyltransferase